MVPCRELPRHLNKLAMTTRRLADKEPPEGCQGSVQLLIVNRSKVQQHSSKANINSFVISERGLCAEPATILECNFGAKISDKLQRATQVHIARCDCMKLARIKIPQSQPLTAVCAIKGYLASREVHDALPIIPDVRMLPSICLARANGIMVVYRSRQGLPREEVPMTPSPIADRTRPCPKCL